MVQGTLLFENINLINVYGLNKDDPKFYNNLFLTISNLSRQYIIAGDFNCTLDPLKDRSSGLDNSHQVEEDNTPFYERAKFVGYMVTWKTKCSGILLLFLHL